MVDNTGGTSRVTQQGNRLGVSTKSVDVFLHPPQSHVLVQQAQVAPWGWFFQTEEPCQKSGPTLIYKNRFCFLLILWSELDRFSIIFSPATTLSCFRIVPLIGHVTRTLDTLRYWNKTLSNFTIALSFNEVLENLCFETLSSFHLATPEQYYWSKFNMIGVNFAARSMRKIAFIKPTSSASSQQLLKMFVAIVQLYVLFVHDYLREMFVFWASDLCY